MTVNIEQDVLESDNFELFDRKVMDANEEYSSLIASHKFLLDYFATKTGGKRMACREDLVPEEITSYLPFVVLLDIEYNDSGKLGDVIIRLLGTGMASIYGEWTGKHFSQEGVETLLQKELPATYERIMSLVNSAIEKKTAIVMTSQQINKDRPQVHVRNIVIPLSDDDNNINMIFLYTDVKSSK